MCWKLWLILGGPDSFGQLEACRDSPPRSLEQQIALQQSGSQPVAQLLATYPCQGRHLWRASAKVLIFRTIKNIQDVLPRRCSIPPDGAAHLVHEQRQHCKVRMDYAPIWRTHQLLSKHRLK